MGRKILLVTTDQQRYDTLGCNGGSLARTPVADGLAAAGIRYERAIPQSVVCMPSRSTILTGQHPTTHGVWMNGVPLPLDAPSVAQVLRDTGYRTALIGKAHFQPYLDPFLRFTENALGRGTTPPGGSHRGFEHLEFATHGAMGQLHYANWLRAAHPEAIGMFYATLDANLQVNAAGWRHRCPAGPRQQRAPGVVPHRLGRRSDDRVARLPRHRRRLVLLDELSRPPPSVGSAAVRDGADRLA
jgi:arylsulfatase A-like enzyme